MPEDIEGRAAGENESRPPREASAQLEVIEPGGTVLKPLDVREVRDSMQTYQRGLASLLDDSDWQQTNDKPFVKKSGWRKIATWFGLSVELVGPAQVMRDSMGKAQRASVVARAIAPNGRSMDGDGHCDVSEPRFARASARQKLENDLIGTATTRAKNRAIADLVGMGEVSAEEVEMTPIVPEAGVAASPELEATARKALTWLFEDLGAAPVENVEREAQKAADVPYLPRSAAQAIVLVAKELRFAHEREDAAAEAAEAEPVEQTQPKEETDGNDEPQDDGRADPSGGDN